MLQSQGTCIARLCTANWRTTKWFCLTVYLNGSRQHAIMEVVSGHPGTINSSTSLGFEMNTATHDIHAVRWWDTAELVRIFAAAALEKMSNRIQFTYAHMSPELKTDVNFAIQGESTLRNSVYSIRRGTTAVYVKVFYTCSIGPSRSRVMKHKIYEIGLSVIATRLLFGARNSS